MDSTPSPPTPHFDQLAPYLQDMVKTLSDTVNRRFDDVDRRLDKMDDRFDRVVSEGEFRSEVKRLEGDISDHRIQVDTRIAQVERDAIAEAAKIRAEILQKSEESARRSKFWLAAIGVVITVVNMGLDLVARLN